MYESIGLNPGPRVSGHYCAQDAPDLGNGLPSGKVRHDVRGEEFASLSVAPLIAIDQQIDALILVLLSALTAATSRIRLISEGS